MNIDHISEQKEIIDFVKDIKDLTDQQKNPTRDGMEKVILNIKNKYRIETEVFEKSTAVATNGVMTDIKNISNDVLFNRLTAYKEIIILKFIEKYGNQMFNNIVKEYKLEV